MKAVFRHELSSYFRTMTGYLFIGFLLLFVGVYSYVYNIQNSLANFEYVLSGMSFVFLLIIPVLTMGVIADERRRNTDQLLYSLPLSMTEVVLGKYFAMLVVLLIPTAIICIYPLVLNLFGNVYLLKTFGAIIGFFFLGAALIAVGMFVSSLTESPAVAAGICFLLLLLNYFMSSLSGYLPATATPSLIAMTALVLIAALIIWMMTRSVGAAGVFAAAAVSILVILYLVNATWFAGLFPKIMSGLSLFERFNSFVDGVFDVKALIFYMTVCVLFVFLSIQSMDKRRWS
ncbi:MAG: ABC transporter permease [Oscillospiraceae bacterium]|nr:ABC transporter permease [Oscillospiraceae bacterium]